ncbi:hypothetical protein AV530_017173 [Patagioenas fasciata monilis]|uniref:Uncharacterized protein n=1 Tax=Patagioenas fasciata monilis TaxID=372326 RepID=A0A1V4JGB4_PATFA|nr:hypothetical protein AV530_017173 [Patagioenas fasciata monilis]
MFSSLNNWSDEIYYLGRHVSLWFLGSRLLRLQEVGLESTVTQLLFQPDYGRALQEPQRGSCIVEHHGGNRNCL